MRYRKLLFPVALVLEHSCIVPVCRLRALAARHSQSSLVDYCVHGCVRGYIELLCLAHPFTGVMQLKKFPAVVGVVVVAMMCSAPFVLRHPLWAPIPTPAMTAEGATILLEGGHSTVPSSSAYFASATSSVATKSVIDAIVAWRSRRRWRRAIGGRARDAGVVAGREEVVSRPVAMRTSRADGLDGLVGGKVRRHCSGHVLVTQRYPGRCG
mmetsp:Transcript_8624/g.18547  ORF Transcript_8624/g.18547 Transcript_8624/m.18547 type:complete len:211 (-) Transcript_8624:585-1217(-)